MGKDTLQVEILKNKIKKVHKENPDNIYQISDRLTIFNEEITIGVSSYFVILTCLTGTYEITGDFTSEESELTNKLTTKLLIEEGFYDHKENNQEEITLIQKIKRFLNFKES